MSDNGPSAFAARLRARERLLGYWVVCDNPVGTERIAGLGYDYVCADGQHGLMAYPGWLSAMTAIDARGVSAGMVRVPANDGYWIGSALDAGARGVIVPLVNNAEDAAAAVSFCRYPPHGVRSYGPMRAGLRVGPRPAESDQAVACVVMIETAGALENLDEICVVPGLDGVYVGPSDLTLALGGRFPGDPDVADAFADATARIAEAAAKAGIAAGFHCPDGATAAARLADGYTFATVSSDLVHLEQAAAAHLKAARSS
ncbi:2,4-dihydroxyhept-2-ene-1,7-dioic acid aldolase [Actinomadura sp. NBRC 104425]|uniref:HpcH/HpaI aldolase family protein n=1 Tax=Actinomadura sp. NBRC 104425 TaxID=3032204 RepID=UPI0024A2B29F|nr:aldolase/citrate lyase family protein [Actinomadura sp. NBRC 104425]GLZ13912.1 2,4-dihydroxyhept-2-ene-1,7-dioic acid aldolase [Actinomadura sp. NBRC 104425]